ncbi:MAG: hypothetical protein EXS14_06175 [Planctomycetes bacterium]|nr:hypothetical protein [Planctomycetota bacterium]
MRKRLELRRKPDNLTAMVNVRNFVSTTLQSSLLFLVLSVALSAQTPVAIASAADDANPLNALPADTKFVLRFAGLAALSANAEDLGWHRLWRDERMQRALTPVLTAWDRSLEDVDPQAALVWAQFKPFFAAPVVLGLCGMREVRWHGEVRHWPDALLCVEAGAEAEALSGTLQTLAGFIGDGDGATLRRDTERHRGCDIASFIRDDQDAKFEVAITTTRGLVLIALDRAMLRTALDRLADPTLANLQKHPAFAVTRPRAGTVTALELWCDLPSVLTHFGAQLPQSLRTVLALPSLFAAKTITLHANMDAGWGSTQITMRSDPYAVLDTTSTTPQTMPASIPATAVLSAGARYDPAAFQALLHDAATASDSVPVLAALRLSANTALAELGISVQQDMLPAIGHEALGYIELSKLASFPNAVLSFEGADVAKLSALLHLTVEKLGITMEMRGPPEQEILHFDMAALFGFKLEPGAEPRPAERRGARPITVASVVQPCFAIRGQRSVLALHERGMTAALDRFRAADSAVTATAPNFQPVDTTHPFDAWLLLDVQRLVSVLVQRAGSGVAWLDATPLGELLADGAATSKVPETRLSLKQHRGALRFVWTGIELATLLSITSRLMLDADGVPPIALTNLARHWPKESAAPSIKPLGDKR